MGRGSEGRGVLAASHCAACSRTAVVPWMSLLSELLVGC